MHHTVAGALQVTWKALLRPMRAAEQEEDTALLGGWNVPAAHRKVQQLEQFTGSQTPRAKPTYRHDHGSFLIPPAQGSDTTADQGHSPPKTASERRRQSQKSSFTSSACCSSLATTVSYTIPLSTHLSASRTHSHG